MLSLRIHPATNLLSLSWLYVRILRKAFSTEGQCSSMGLGKVTLVGASGENRLSFL